MSNETIRITGGIIARVTAKRRDNYDVSGSFGKYAFIATVFDTNKTFGILGSRIVSLEMFRAKKSLSGDLKILPILRCFNGRWSIKTPTKNDFNASCTLLYNLDQFLPRFKTASSK